MPSTRHHVKGNCSTEHSKGNKTIPGKVATTCTGDGHKQTTKTSTTISTKRTKKHRTTEEEMEGPTSSRGSRNRLTCLTLQEHEDDDDDETKRLSLSTMSEVFFEQFLSFSRYMPGYIKSGHEPFLPLSFQVIIY